MKKTIRWKKLAISFTLALVIFITLLFVEKNALGNESSIAVVKAIRDMEAGFALSGEDWEQYVQLDYVAEGKVPEGAYSSLEEVQNLILNRDVFTNELLTTRNAGEEQEYVLGFENPVEVGIKVNDVSQVVGGVLREGDLVNVSLVNGATNENEEILREALVVRAIHADGTPVTREDEDKSAIIINLLIDKGDEAVLNQSVNLGVLRLSKQVAR